MKTLSEFFLLGGGIGAVTGRNSSKKGEDRKTALNKAISRGGLASAALGTGLGYLGARSLGLRGKKALGLAADSGLQSGAIGTLTSAAGSQLGYREKFKKEYDENNRK